MKLAARTIVFVAGLALGGCVTAQPPKQSHIDASAAVRAAEEISKDAPSPEAELYLSKARSHMRAGEAQLEKSNYRSARLHFERAEVDAEAALSLARATKAEQEAQIAEARIEGLAREEQAVLQDARDDDDDDDDDDRGDVEVDIDVDD
jgi:hypothetical protein